MLSRYVHRMPYTYVYLAFYIYITHLKVWVRYGLGTGWVQVKNSLKINTRRLQSKTDVFWFIPKASPMLGFSFSGSDTEATRGWTEGKPWEIAWVEPRWEWARRKHRQGGRTGNHGKYYSLGRAPLGRSEMEPWELAWGELRWEGARRKRRQGGRTRNRGK